MVSVSPAGLRGKFRSRGLLQICPHRQHKDDAKTNPVAGVAMMGGGSDLDEAFAWLCNKGNGGDFLILRATGDDDYNSYINKLCKTNSVATLIIPSREAAEDPAGRRDYPQSGSDIHRRRRPGELHSQVEGNAGAERDEREY